jgi:hypothetical protein
MLTIKTSSLTFTANADNKEAISDFAQQILTNKYAISDLAQKKLTKRRHL